MTDWVITLPKAIEWSDYEKEFAAVKDWSQVMNYRLARFPKGLQSNDRCFVCYRGKIRGWMRIVSWKLHWYDMVCSTTGAPWPKGFYLHRSGPFTYVDGPEMRGFQGIRRLKHE